MLIVYEDRVVAGFSHSDCRALGTVAPDIAVVPRWGCQHGSLSWAQHGSTFQGQVERVNLTRGFDDVVVSVDGGVRQGHCKTAGEVHHSAVDVVGGTQSEVGMRCTGNAVALSSANVAELNAPWAIQGYLSTNGVTVGFDALDVEAHPVVVAALVDVKLVRVVVVWAHVDAAVARHKVHLTIASEIAGCKAQHGVSVCKGETELFKCAVPVAFEVVIGAVVAGGHKVEVSVVVKVLKLALQEEATDVHATAFGDVCVVTVPVIFKEVHVGAVVGHRDVHVTIVVNVPKVSCPALLKEHQAALSRFFGPPSLSVVDPELVDTAGVLRVTHELAALGDEQVYVSVTVKVREYRAVVAAVICAGIVTEVIAGQGHECGVIQREPRFITFPHAAQCIVMATKCVEDAIVVEVCHVARLHEHLSIVEVIQLEIPARPDAHEVHAIIAAARKNVLDSIVVHVANARTPLVGGADLTVVHRVETGSSLVQDVDVVALVEEHDVVQTVIVNIDKANGAATVESVTEQWRADVKGLG